MILGGRATCRDFVMTAATVCCMWKSNPLGLLELFRSIARARARACLAPSRRNGFREGDINSQGNRVGHRSDLSRATPGFRPSSPKGIHHCPCTAIFSIDRSVAEASLGQPRAKLLNTRAIVLDLLHFCVAKRRASEPSAVAEYADDRDSTLPLPLSFPLPDI